MLGFEHDAASARKRRRDSRTLLRVYSKRGGRSTSSLCPLESPGTGRHCDTGPKVVYVQVQQDFSAGNADEQICSRMRVESVSAGTLRLKSWCNIRMVGHRYFRQVHPGCQRLDRRECCASRLAGEPRLTSDAILEPAATSGSPRRPTLAEAFSPRHNSLNFIRLAMCFSVIVSHSITLGGFGSEWTLGGRTTIGLPALFGFFGLSGFLIAGSATKNSVGRYAWQRFLRIMPAYWLCIVITAFIIGALAWKHQHHLAACNIYSCYYSIHGDGPLNYLYHNWLLAVNQVNIGSTPSGGPVPYFWNNSVWTLLPEVFCYSILAALASLKLLRNRHVLLGLTCVVWLVEVVFAWWAPANNVPHSFGPFTIPPSFLFGTAMLTPVFLTGSLLYLYRDKIPDSGWLALGCVAVFAAGAWLPFFGQEMAHFTHFLPGASSVMAPAVAYPFLWLGIHLPSLFQRIGARNDYSYGVYIYGWPVQQLLGMWGVQHHGYVAYTGSAIIGALAFAVLSWHLVEKRALSLKKLDPRVIFMTSTRRLDPRSRCETAVSGLMHSEVARPNRSATLARFRQNRRGRSLCMAPTEGSAEVGNQATLLERHELDPWTPPNEAWGAWECEGGDASRWCGLATAERAKQIASHLDDVTSAAQSAVPNPHPSDCVRNGPRHARGHGTSGHFGRGIPESTF